MSGARTHRSGAWTHRSGAWTRRSGAWTRRRGCPGDRALVMACYGEAEPSVREHMETCPRCVAHRDAVARDLDLITEVLSGPPPVLRHRPRSSALVWRRVLAAAVAVGVIVLGGTELWMWRVSSSLTRGTDDSQALFGEITSVLAPAGDGSILALESASVDGEHELAGLDAESVEPEQE